MIPASFGYTRAASLSDAVAAVGGGAKILAGGQSLLPLLKLRLASADQLIDIGRIAELKGYRHTDDGVVEIEARVHECRDRIANVADPTRRVVRSQHALREQVCRRDAAYSRVVEVAFLERQGNRQLVGDDRHFDATDSW